MEKKKKPELTAHEDGWEVGPFTTKDLDSWIDNALKDPKVLEALDSFDQELDELEIEEN